MITLLHGDNIEASRQKLEQLRKGKQESDVRVMEGKSLDITALHQALTPMSFLAGNVCVIIENFFSKANKKSKNFPVIIDILKSAADSNDIILWEQAEVSKTHISGLGTGVHVQMFKLPASIFYLLDSMKPGNKVVALRFLSQTLATEQPELVLALLARRVRQLLIVGSGSSVSALADWQRARLTAQAGFFTIEKLRAIYRELLSIEYSQKSGTSPLQLPLMLEQWIIRV